MVKIYMDNGYNKPKENGTVCQEQKLLDLEELLNHKDKQLAQLYEELCDVKKTAAVRHSRILDLEKSLSWKITKPLRLLCDFIAQGKHARKLFNIFAYIKHHVRNSETDTTLCNTAVDIIVYAASVPSIIRTCLSSVVTNSEHCRIIVVDDATEDGHIEEFLQQIVSSGKRMEYRVLHNEEVQGVVRSIKKALSICSNSNLVVLTTEAEVPPGWLERLMAPILKDTSVATASPFSNDVRLLNSLQIEAFNPLLSEIDVETLDGYFKSLGPLQPTELQTGGADFCTAYSRKAIDELFLFENDHHHSVLNNFSRRAIAAGYRNVLVPNLFVNRQVIPEDVETNSGHSSDAPFAIDPLEGRPRPSREVDDSLQLLLAACAESDKNTIALLDFDIGGGSGLYSQSLIQFFIKSGYGLIHLKFVQQNQALSLYYLKEGQDPTCACIAETNEIDKLLCLFSVEFIMVNQLITWPDPQNIIAKVVYSNIPYLVFIHDFYYICQKYLLIDGTGNFCDIPSDKNICKSCIKNSRTYDHLWNNEFPMDSPVDWRKKTQPFLSHAVKVICFSESSHRYLGRVFPELRNLQINEHFIPNSEDFKWNTRRHRSQMLTIAIIGNIDQAKGKDIIIELVGSEAFRKLPVRLVVIGSMDRPIYDDGKLLIHGIYNRRELPFLLEFYDTSMVLIPSVWPETFSFTTSEALLLGYPVICLDVGAQAERIKMAGAGKVVSPPFIPGLLALFKDVVACPELVEQWSSNSKKYIPPSSKRHLAVIDSIVGSSIRSRKLAQ